MLEHALYPAIERCSVLEFVATDFSLTTTQEDGEYNDDT
jgi:hypothetical protein